MQEFTLEDEFGRRTVFTGDLLVDDHTDTSSGNKPQWLEIAVWRTQGGSFVVRRINRYRIRHSRESCPRAEGYDLVPASEDDTYLCPSCNDVPHAGAYYAQEPRISVEVYHQPQDLIDSFRTDGRYNNLARAILADLADLDERIDEQWSTVVVP